MIYPLHLFVALIAAALYLFDADGNSAGPFGNDTLGGSIEEYMVEPEDLVSGGPGKDGIPSIDDSKFVSVAEADEWIDDGDNVLVIIHEGVKKVYPLQIMVRHEIVNDVIKGDPVAVTYCPLCDSALAFLREIDDEAVEFGVSGKLYNSNLVMYDRKTDSYWSQIIGRAIIGPLEGTKLTPVSVDTVRWSGFKREHPDSQVLSRETGFDKSYGFDPYTGYYTSDQIWFPVEHRDDILHPKTVVFGLEVKESFEAYLDEDLKALGTIEDVVGDAKIRLERDQVGLVRATSLETGEDMIKVRCFWFSWYAFHPETGVYDRTDCGPFFIRETSS